MGPTNTASMVAGALALALLGTLPGCGEAARPQRRGRPQQPAAAALTAPAAEPTPAAPRRPAKKSADFKPPFPDRTDLFSPPNRAAVARTSRRSGSPDVALKGIADVEGLRALVQIGSQVFPLRQGEERNGVRIVSIDPPRVTLQRGEQRWTASLFEK